MKIILKNVMSIQCQHRKDEMFEELEEIEWDAVFINETWRAAREEVWTSEGGRLFCGSGGSEGHCGVAIVINNKCNARFRAFHAVSERICAVDVDMSKQRFRFVCAYLPHGGYPDAAVEELYLQLTSSCNQGKKLKRMVVVCGDWNAVVGVRLHGDDSRSGSARH